MWGVSRSCVKFHSNWVVYIRNGKNLGHFRTWNFTKVCNLSHPEELTPWSWHIKAQGLGFFMIYEYHGKNFHVSKTKNMFTMDIHPPVTRCYLYGYHSQSWVLKMTSTARKAQLPTLRHRRRLRRTNGSLKGPWCTAGDPLKGAEKGSIFYAIYML